MGNCQKLQIDFYQYITCIGKAYGRLTPGLTTMFITLHSTVLIPLSHLEASCAAEQIVHSSGSF